MLFTGHFVRSHSLLITTLFIWFGSVVGQLFERVSVPENIQPNSVILDLRTALVRHGHGQLPPNATAYASEQEAFWPFVLENFVIKLGRPLDREATCARQRFGRRLDSLGAPDHTQTESGCLAGACCQLLHVNILLSPTSLPEPFYVQVAVQDVNDNPPRFPHVQIPHIRLREDTGLDDKIWLPQAFDPDSARYGITEYRVKNWVQGNETHFQLGVTDTDSLSFSASGHPENLYLEQSPPSTFPGRPYLLPTGPLDREKDEVYAFTLIAIDGGDRDVMDESTQTRALTGSVNIIIKIDDVNDNRPVFSDQIYSVKVVENVMVTNVLEFEVSDGDIGDNGRVSVTVDDPSGQAQRLFRVGLQPISSNSLNAQSSSKLYKPNLKPAGSQYRGVLQLINPVDAELYPAVLRFGLVAKDHGQPILSSRAEVHVHIINTNDNAPVIAFFSHGKRLMEGRLSLPEVETPPRALVVLIHVTDNDSPVAQIRCQLVQETDTFSLEDASGSNFPAHRSEGLFETVIESRGIVASYRQFVLRTKTELDRESKSYYVVIVECTDSEGSQALARNASLHITVTDVNDHSPTFDKKVYTGRVAENVAAAELQLTSPMTVTDADLGANALLTFSLADFENNTDLNHPAGNSLYFRVDSRSGRIWTTIPLDCETRSEYSLLITVRDSGTPKPLSSTALIHVTVEDANDNSPEFTTSHYLFEVAENSPGGTEIGRAEAVDKDVTLVNRRIRYSLRGRPEDVHLVSINRTTGVLQTRRPIDRESRSSISLLVIAENEAPLRLSKMTTIGDKDATGVHQRLSAEASLVVSILNENDNAPEFTLIEPHRSHLTFIWEQLGPPYISANETASKKLVTSEPRTNGSSGKNDSSKAHESTHVFSYTNNPVCERLPHRVSDKDIGPENNYECCILELLDDFDGLFALMPDALNVLCVMHRPPRPQSYKLTIVAKDGLDNKSLSSQIQITVVIRSDPNLQDTGLPSRRSMSGVPHSDHSGTEEGGHGSLTNQVGYHSRWPDDLSQEDYQAERSRFAYSGNSRSSRSNGYNQTVVIIVMASVAGVLCVLLLLAIILTRKCMFESKSPFVKNDQGEGDECTVGLRSPGSIQSSPTKVPSCTLLPVRSHAVMPGYYSKEMIYQHPLGQPDVIYDMTAKRIREEHGLISPTIARNVLVKNSNEAVFLNAPTLLPLNYRKESEVCTSTSSQPFDREDDLKKSSATDTPTVSPSNQSCSPNHKNILMRAPLPPSSTHLATVMGKFGPGNRILNPPLTSGPQIGRRIIIGNGSQDIYQTIDSRLAPRMQFTTVKPMNNSTVLTRSYSKIRRISQVQDGNKPVRDSNGSDTGQSASGFEFEDLVQNDTDETHEYVPIRKLPTRLYRTNSERSGYLQSSFV